MPRREKPSYVVYYYGPSDTKAVIGEYRTMRDGRKAAARAMGVPGFSALEEGTIIDGGTPYPAYFDPLGDGSSCVVIRRIARAGRTGPAV